MKVLADYVMRGRMQAAGAAGLLGLGAMVLPPLSFLSGAIVALVGLRQGLNQAALVSLLAAIMFGLVAMLSLQSLLPLLVQLGAVWLPALVVAEVLRRSESQGHMVMAAALFGLLASLGLRAWVGDSEQWWSALLQELVLSAYEGQAVTPDTQSIDQAARMMGSLVAAGVMMNTVIYLLIGRWWQASLYFPGGFRQEFARLSLPRLLMPMLLLPVVYCLATGQELMQAGLASDVLMVSLCGWMLQGLSVMHVLADRYRMNPVVLVVMYVLLVLSGLLGMLLLATVGMVDAARDVRGIRTQKPEQ